MISCQGSRALILQQTCRGSHSAASRPILQKKNASCSIGITTFAPLQTQKHFFCSRQFIDKIWPFAERCRLVAKISLPIFSFFFSELCRKCGKSQVIAGGRCIFEECPARISLEIDFLKTFATKTGRNN